MIDLPLGEIVINPGAYEAPIWESQGVAYDNCILAQDGREYHRSTDVKSWLVKGFFGGSSSTKLGHDVHRMFYHLVSGEEFNITKQSARKNSNAYLDELASLNERYPHGNFCLCSESVYKKMLLRKRQFELNGHMIKGACPEIVYLSKADGVGIFGNINMKAQIDIRREVEGRYQIIDFKTTSKTTLSEIVHQMRNLHYDLQMLYYYTAVARIHGGDKTSPNAELWFFPESTDADIVKIVLPMAKIEKYYKDNWFKGRTLKDYKADYDYMHQTGVYIYDGQSLTRA